MVGDFDTPQYLQRSSICCEVLFRTESRPLEIGAWYSRIHNGTCGFGITYQRGTTVVGISLEVYADADYASRATDRRSVSVGVIMCAGACVCWFCRTQKCVTLSTSEAESVALGDAVKELLFLRQVWRFMVPGKGMPCFPVFEDNQGALQLSKNPVSNSNSKHIDVHNHFLRELVRQGDIIVNHVPSEYQHADIFTKVLAFDLFAIHRGFSMNLSDSSSCDLVDQQVNVCMFVGVFKCLHSWGAVPISVERK